MSNLLRLLSPSLCKNCNDFVPCDKDGVCMTCNQDVPSPLPSDNGGEMRCTMLLFSFHLLCYVLLALRTDKGYLPEVPRIFRAINQLELLGLIERRGMVDAFDVTPQGEALAQALLAALPNGAPTFRATAAPWRVSWFRSKVW